MEEKTLNVAEFFDLCKAVKEERGANYDNGGRSAYELSLSMFDSNNRYLVAIWPVIQKASRLITLAQDAQKGNFDVEAWDDTSKDLANYTAMQWLTIAKPALPVDTTTKTDKPIAVGDNK